jgi:long-chain acyl-CoA synthetase
VIEKVRRFTLADEPFSIDNRQLTPHSRSAATQSGVYGARMDGLYAK